MMVDWIKEWKPSAAEPSGVLSMNYDKVQLLGIVKKRRGEETAATAGKQQMHGNGAGGQLEH